LGHAGMELRAFPPLVVVVGGARSTFSPAWGEWLVGVARAGLELVLLGHDGDRALIFRGDGERFSLVGAWRRSEFPIEIHLDPAGLRPSEPTKPPRRQRLPVDTPAAVHRHHDRILAGGVLSEVD